MWAGTRNSPDCYCALGALTKTASAIDVAADIILICNIIQIVYCMLRWLENKLFVFVFVFLVRLCECLLQFVRPNNIL